MGCKTRYLQLGPTMMLEYIMSDGLESGSGQNRTVYLTRLKDGHHSMVFPAGVEVGEKNGKYVKNEYDADYTINTINHYSIPMDKDDSKWFMFLDPDNMKVGEGNLNTLSQTDYKVKTYIEFCSAPVGALSTENPFMRISDLKCGWDTVKIYFTSGYDFTDLYSLLFRLYVNRTDGGCLDLCDISILKANAYKMVDYLTDPVIFGNFIYDKYVEIRVPAFMDIINDMEHKSLFMVDPASPIKLMVASVEGENDITIKSAKYLPGDTFRTEEYLRDVLCEFTRTSSVKGVIPTERLNSDNIGVYMSPCPDRPYIEYYGTWKGDALDFRTVYLFNKDIALYDRSLVKKTTVQYEATDEVGYDLTQWIAVHEIRCTLYTGGEGTDDPIVLANDSYSMTQTFASPNDRNVFYYRPCIFDDFNTTQLSSCVLSIDYDMRLINVRDGVQFLKHGALTITGNELSRFCANTTDLGFAETMPYKIYNRISENKQNIISQKGGVSKVKYIRTYYNSTDVRMSAGGEQEETTNLVMSTAPKNYKFVFKMKNKENKYDFMDLSDSYYKLYVRMPNGKDIVVEPTYSDNMNMLLGELEFAIGGGILNRLMSLPETSRRMSIVTQNPDNSLSSLCDITFTF